MTLRAGARRLEAALFEPVDIAPLVAWRILFGSLMVLEAVGAMLTGWVQEAFVAPSFHFTYFGFEWVRVIPGYSMYAHFTLLAILGVMVAIGLWYRAAAALLAVAWAYAFLLEKAFYQNHYYLIALLSFLMILVPANRAASLDVRRRPERRSDVTCAWTLDVFRVLVVLVYFFGGVAKLNADWLRLLPIEQWLQANASYPIVGPLYASRYTAMVFAYGGLVFDLAVGPLLLWRRTRLLAVAAAVLFHLINLATFRIGIFPLLGIAFTLLFLPPSWFRRALGRLLGPRAATPVVVPGRHPLVAPFLGLFMFAQIAIPLRHWLIDSDVAWSEEGHRFSWRMKLRDKSGVVVFHVRDPDTGQTFDVRPEQVLHGRQIARVATEPDLIWQFARHLEARARQDGLGDVEVRATTRVSLNFRPRQPIVDPTVDLTRVEYRLRAANRWILPLDR